MGNRVPASSNGMYLVYIHTLLAVGTTTKQLPFCHLKRVKIQGQLQWQPAIFTILPPSRIKSQLLKLETFLVNPVPFSQINEVGAYTYIFKDTQNGNNK